MTKVIVTGKDASGKVQMNLPVLQQQKGPTLSCWALRCAQHDTGWPFTLARTRLHRWTLLKKAMDAINRARTPAINGKRRLIWWE